METFTQAKDLSDNPRFGEQRRDYLSKLDLDIIDAPIVDIIQSFARLSYCFTLQSCCGHFLHAGQRAPQNTEPLPASTRIRSVEYRLAYVALCVQDSGRGRALLDALAGIPRIDPDYIQFGCAEWFWERQVNSYVLQVEPARHMTKDKCTVPHREALRIQKIRDEFFGVLRALVQPLAVANP